MPAPSSEPLHRDRRKFTTKWAVSVNSIVSRPPGPLRPLLITAGMWRGRPESPYSPPAPLFLAGGLSCQSRVGQHQALWRGLVGGLHQPLQGEGVGHHRWGIPWDASPAGSGTERQGQRQQEGPRKGQLFASTLLFQPGAAIFCLHTRDGVLRKTPHLKGPHCFQASELPTSAPLALAGAFPLLQETLKSEAEGSSANSSSDISGSQG